MKTVRCDWCKSIRWENVGTEWSGHAILHCKDCSHEWVETMILNDATRPERFAEFIEEVLDDLKKPK